MDRLSLAFIGSRSLSSTIGSCLSALREHGLTITTPGGTYFVPWMVPVEFAAMVLIILAVALHLSGTKMDH